MTTRPPGRNVPLDDEGRPPEPLIATDSDLFNQVRMLFPWLPEALVRVYATAWAGPAAGDPQLAWAYVRADDLYDVYFPGNRRDDGTFRYEEFEYWSTMEGYADVFRSVGLNPDLWRDHFVTLLEGEVSPDELAAERIEPVFERVLDSSPEIRAYYADVYGLELTDSAILASALDPELGERILNRQISIAEIGGEAALRGFDLAATYAESMYRQGIGRGQAQELFGEAAQDLPILNVLAQRHDDPDDDFDIYEFTNAAVFDDPTQRRRMRRLIAQERQSFTQSVGMGALHTRNERGGMSGLSLT